MLYINNLTIFNPCGCLILTPLFAASMVNNLFMNVWMLLLEEICSLAIFILKHERRRFFHPLHNPTQFLIFQRKTKHLFQTINTIWYAELSILWFNGLLKAQFFAIIERKLLLLCTSWLSIESALIYAPIINPPWTGGSLEKRNYTALKANLPLVFVCVVLSLVSPTMHKSSIIYVQTHTRVVNEHTPCLLKVQSECALNKFTMWLSAELMSFAVQ